MGGSRRSIRRFIRLSTRLAAAGLALAWLAACDDEPAALQADLSAKDQAVCQDLVADLPETLAGQTRNDANDDSAIFTASYGDPELVVTCGVGKPSGFDLTSPCEQANGVGYYLPVEVYDDQSIDVPITAAGYRPRVQVQVPAEYRPGGVADAMAALAPLVKQHLKLVQPCDNGDS